MPKGKEKVIEVDDDELDFLLGLLADPTFDPMILLEPIRSSTGIGARRMSHEVTTSPSNSDNKGSSGSEDTLNEDPSEDSGEVSPPGVSRPEKKKKLGSRALVEHYAINLMTCMTTVENLVELQTIYEIPDGIPLRVLGKKDIPNQPPRGMLL
ncbi:hypothetical protein AB3S75_012346 [Citrus x aurantiifolia]